MKGVLRTFKHLVVIAVFVVLIVAIIMSTPGSRQWAMGQAGRVTDVVGRSEVATLVGSAVGNLDPEVIAEVVNDPDSRESLVELITDVIPELDSASVAELVNGIVDNPELANFIIALLPEIDQGVA